MSFDNLGEVIDELCLGATEETFGDLDDNARPEISSEFKQQIGHSVALWYDEYHEAEFGGNIPRDKWERDYPFAVLLPVVMMLIFPKEIIQITLESPPKTNSENRVFTREDFHLPTWQGEYNNIAQNNTCPLDNIIAILSLFKEKIIESCGILGSTPADARFHELMTLVNEFNFDKLRDFIAKEIGMQTTYSDLMEQYDFYGSEGTIIKYLQSLNLCNDKYTSTFYCHQCHSTFTWSCMLGIIGSVITNIEYSISAKLLPSKCNKCGCRQTDKFEIRSSQFDFIPPLLTIEIGHLPKSCLLLPDINTHFTINHKNKLLRYELAGVSIHLSNHFYSLIRLDNQFYKFDSIRESTLEIYPNSSFIGTVNTVYYTLHSSE